MGGVRYAHRHIVTGDGNRYAMHTAGSVSVGPTLSPAVKKKSTSGGVRYAYRCTEGGDENRYAKHSAGSVSVGPTLSPAVEGCSTESGVMCARHTEEGGSHRYVGTVVDWSTVLCDMVNRSVTWADRSDTW